jgi:hypothetical protein
VATRTVNPELTFSFFEGESSSIVEALVDFRFFLSGRAPREGATTDFRSLVERRMANCTGTWGKVLTVLGLTGALAEKNCDAGIEPGTRLSSSSFIMAVGRKQESGKQEKWSWHAKGPALNSDTRSVDGTDPNGHRAEYRVREKNTTSRVYRGGFKDHL